MPRNATQQRKAPQASGLKPLPPPTPADRRDPDLRRWIEKVKALPDVREDKVRAIRAALEAGIYDVDSRLDDLCDQWTDKLDRLTDIDP